jgi:hypothetical protein
MTCRIRRSPQLPAPRSRAYTHAPITCRQLSRLEGGPAASMPHRARPSCGSPAPPLAGHALSQSCRDGQERARVLPAWYHCVTLHALTREPDHLGTSSAVPLRTVSATCNQLAHQSRRYARLDSLLLTRNAANRTNNLLPAPRLRCLPLLRVRTRARPARDGRAARPGCGPGGAPAPKIPASSVLPGGVPSLRCSFDADVPELALPCPSRRSSSAIRSPSGGAAPARSPAPP